MVLWETMTNKSVSVLVRNSNPSEAPRTYTGILDGVDEVMGFIFMDVSDRDKHADKKAFNVNDVITIARLKISNDQI